MQSIPRVVLWGSQASSAIGLRSTPTRSISIHSGDGVAFMQGPHGGDHHLVAFAKGPGAALHHLSWDVPTVDDVGLGMSRMQAEGYETGWGLAATC